MTARAGWAQIDRTLEGLYAGDALSEAKAALRTTLDDALNERRTPAAPARPLDETDVMLIAYGDAITRRGEKPLETLRAFLKERLDREITNVHLLPIFPYTSDDGFSVSDYATIDPALGDWADVEALARDRGVMLDAVVNHTSQRHDWFRRCLRGESPYRDYYIACDPDADYAAVVRPRSLPLLTAFETNEGERHFWTTFSADQIDVNFASPALLREMVRVLLLYAARGARFIRLDAIGFAWKKLGTYCMSLPETHALVKLFRLALAAVYPGTMLITETNVPHAENISYFGDGDEAHLVYQFPLPPLTLHAILAGDATRLTSWAQSLEATPLPPGATYFNFLASHDGIGLRPIQGILDDDALKTLLDATLAHGGRVGMRATADGGQVPYELNISYMDALTPPDAPDDLRIARFMAAQAVMLSMRGVPGIYYHSLLGSRNWQDGVRESGIFRRINREKLDADALSAALSDEGGLRARVLSAYKRMLSARAACGAFSPYAQQTVQKLDPRVFALERVNPKTGERLLARVNLSDQRVPLDEPARGVDLLPTGGEAGSLAPYQVRWVRAES